ncbi:hypothetical protein ACFLSE_04935 [Bacteroidota bacterium]
MRKVKILYFISLIFLALSCEKDDLTQPVEVKFEFSMDSFHMDGVSKAGSTFDIDEGIIIINEIEFDGRRDQGEDYYFTSGFSSPVMIQMHNGVMSQEMSYDIPQGVYNRIELNLSLGDTNQYALQLKGRFQRGPMEEVLVEFEYEFQEQIRIRARNNQGNEQVVLTKNSDLTANVIMDVPYLFQLVNMNMIQNAEMTNNGGTQILEINNNKNTNIFNLLATRLDNSMRVVFD